MKSLVFQGAEKVIVNEREIPVLGENTALVRVDFCGICGSDMLIFSGKHPRVNSERILGHEFYGEVVDVKGDGFLKGDRVVCYPLISCGDCKPCNNNLAYVCKDLKLYGIDREGGMANYCVVDLDKLIKVPLELKDPLPALIEPLAVAIHAIKKSGFKDGDSAVVIGSGPIGSLIAWVLGKKSEKIFLTGKNENKIECARNMGLNVVNVRKEEIKVREVDYVFECAGVEGVVEEAMKVIGVAGKIVIVSLHKEHERKVDLFKTVFEELELIGARVYRKEDFKDAIDFAIDNQEDLSKIITKVVRLEEADKVFYEDFKKNMKVLIDCRRN